MDNFGVRVYQSGKTRHSNANKKKNMKRYREMLAEQQQQHEHHIDLPPLKQLHEVVSLTA